jgi:hypothetical protein
MTGDSLSETQLNDLFAKLKVVYDGLDEAQQAFLVAVFQIADDVIGQPGDEPAFKGDFDHAFQPEQAEQIIGAAQAEVLYSSSSHAHGSRPMLISRLISRHPTS